MDGWPTFILDMVPGFLTLGAKSFFLPYAALQGGKNGSVSGGDSQLSRVEIPPEVLLKAGPDRTQS